MGFVNLTFSSGNFDPFKLYGSIWVAFYLKEKGEHIKNSKRLKLESYPKLVFLMHKAFYVFLFKSQDLNLNYN